jgi:glycosyltransferase involved in cell wall biosynthesis
MPVFNEIGTIEAIIERVKQANSLDLEKEIIIIDDGSTDGTTRLLRKIKNNNIKTVFHQKNRGKGAAVRTGIGVATGDILLSQDADMEYHPEEYPTLLEPFLKDETMVVYGSRELSGKNKHSSPLFYAGGKTVTFVTNLLFRSKLTDVPTCYKVFRRDILSDIPLRCERFEFCPEVTAHLLKRKIKILEVPINYTSRKKAEGKKIKARDGIEAILTLIRCRIER